MTPEKTSNPDSDKCRKLLLLELEEVELLLQLQLSRAQRARAATTIEKFHPMPRPPAVNMDNLETQPMDETQMMGHNLETQPMDETQMMDESFSSKFQPCALSKAQTSFKDECVPGIVGEHNGSMTFDEEPLGKYLLCSPFDSDQYMINSDGYALMAPLSPPQELEVDANDGLQDPLSPPQESEGVASLESPLSPSLEPE
ncbi:unnamed protein product [Cladocopium goreaui]|uniref:Uncharacterized protein n=1 Tax=Cladocopium goreaui TaxID=2562237 RepID=A0A9P1CS91_9DINO|nr:unnamed protein product [Cladocopium goreaui]